jgi:hypothetical protein
VVTVEVRTVDQRWLKASLLMKVFLMAVRYLAKPAKSPKSSLCLELRVGVDVVL